MKIKRGKDDKDKNDHGNKDINDNNSISSTNKNPLLDHSDKKPQASAISSKSESVEYIVPLSKNQDDLKLPPHLAKKQILQPSPNSEETIPLLEKKHVSQTSHNNEGTIPLYLLSKKRKAEESIDPVINSEGLKEFIRNKKPREEYFDFKENINKAVDCFNTGNREDFFRIFDKLEIYKKSTKNFRKINQHLMDSEKEGMFTKDDNNVNKDKSTLAGLIDNDLFDSLNPEDDQNNDPELDHARFELENKNYVNNKIKKELLQLNSFSEFEKSIVTDDSKYNVVKDEDGEASLEVVKKNQKDKANEERSLKKNEKRRITVLTSCRKCYGAKLNERAVISVSTYAYLSYPVDDGSITEYHMVISTKEHVNSLAAVDETVYEEIRNYMKCVIAFNAKRDMSTIFLEHSQSADKVDHFHIECIPIKHTMLEDSKIYYKKALQDQDTEWSSHKKNLDTYKHKGNMTKILNENFSYIHVDFNAAGGFLHVIEDETKFSKTFLKEVLCHIIKKDVSQIKYPNKLGMKELIETVDAYREKFSYFDWVNYSA